MFGDISRNIWRNSPEFLATFTGIWHYPYSPRSPHSVPVFLIIYIATSTLLIIKLYNYNSIELPNLNRLRKHIEKTRSSQDFTLIYSSTEWSFSLWLSLKIKENLHIYWNKPKLFHYNFFGHLFVLFFCRRFQSLSFIFCFHGFWH